MVFDSSGAVVPEAEVLAIDQQRRTVRSTFSNHTGWYAIPLLPPGMYRLTVSAPGLRAVAQSNIELSVGRVLRLDVELPVGAMRVSVDVVADPLPVDTENATLGQVIENERVVGLPLNGRGFHELVRLTPGAALLPMFGSAVNRIRPNSIAGMTIGGVPGRQITFLVDGFDVSDNLGGTYVRTSIDAIREFKVHQNVYSAEYSGAGGAFNLTTKSGSNELHGAVFEFLRNDAADSRDFFAAERQALKRNQFGASMGGPAVPNQAFWFATYDATRERVGQVFNNIVPTAQIRSGDFTGEGSARLYDPQTGGPGGARLPFADNRIPRSRLSPQAEYFNAFIPEPNAGPSAALFAPTQEVSVDQLLLRGDQVLGTRHRLFERYSLHDNRLLDPSSFPALGRSPLHTRGQNFAVSLTSMLTPSAIHEARFSYMLGTLRNTPYLVDRDFNAEAGIAGFEETRRPDVAGSFPDFSWSGYAPMSGSAFDQRPKTQHRVTFDYMDNVTAIAGRHVAKFGVRFKRLESLFTDSRQYVGLWSFTGLNTENPVAPGYTGDAFADWLLGAPRSGQRSFAASDFGGTANYWHFFAQDDFKPHEKLTLTLGLRYELSPWMRGHRGQLGAFDPTRARPLILASETDRLDLQAQAAAAVAYPLFQDLIQTSSQAGLPLRITATDLNQWAPRLGFAWRPWGKSTVLRGGFGLFYESEYSPARVNITIVPFKLDEVVFNERGVAPGRSLGDFFLGSPIGSAATAPTIDPTLPKLRAGQFRHHNVGIQQAIGTRTVFEVNYVGNDSNHLQSAIDYNLPSAGAGPVQARRPYPRFGRSRYRADGDSSSYHSLQARVERRLSQGLWYLASYSYSKTLWTRQAPEVGGNGAVERAPWQADIPHVLSFAASYDLPFGGAAAKGKAAPWLGAAVGGWQIQALVSLRSGRPFTPMVSRDVANIGIGGQRPDRLGDGRLEHPTVERWFDTDAFRAPAPYTYGNSGGFILREDAFRSWDVALLKTVKLSEESKLQLRLEAFNLPNTPSFSAPTGLVDVPGGARVTQTANSPRQMQFAVKYLF